ncbi:hypothetical protein MTO96_040780, partial [Rhipicephalus appendiculatus]
MISSISQRKRRAVWLYDNISHPFCNTTFLHHLPTYEKQGVVTTLHKARHGFEDGDYVTFSDVRGMTEINDGPPMEVIVLSPHRFSVMAKYNGITGTGGIATEYKMPKDMNF